MAPHHLKTRTLAAAHVDAAGKTTTTIASFTTLVRSTKSVKLTKVRRQMRSSVAEQERGITIKTCQQLTMKDRKHHRQ